MSLKLKMKKRRWENKKKKVNMLFGPVPNQFGPLPMLSPPAHRHRARTHWRVGPTCRFPGQLRTHPRALICITVKPGPYVSQGASLFLSPHGLQVGPACHLYPFPLLRCACFVSAPTTAGFRAGCANNARSASLARGLTDQRGPVSRHRAVGLLLGRGFRGARSVCANRGVRCGRLGPFLRDYKVVGLGPVPPIPRSPSSTS